jgi:hypothetical protein
MIAYGNNQRARDIAMDAIRTLKPASKKPKALMTYVNTINKHRQDLANAGITIKDASIEAMRAVNKRMSYWVDQYAIRLGQNTTDPTKEFFSEYPDEQFVGFMRWFVLQAQKYQDSDDDDDDSGIMDDSIAMFATQVSKTKPSTPAKPAPASTAVQPTTPVKTPETQQNKPKPKFHRRKQFACAFCTQEHREDNCTLDLNARYTMVEQLSLCKCCLRTGHRADDCPSDLTCYHCGNRKIWKRHHTALCKSADAIEFRKVGGIIDWKKYYAIRDNSESYQQSSLAKKKKTSPAKSPGKSLRTAFTNLMKAFAAQAGSESESENEDTDSAVVSAEKSEPKSDDKTAETAKD